MSAPTVTKDHIEDLLARSTFESTKLGPKSTIVHCTLPNGFALIESSSCVDPANYDHELGVEIAKKRIAERIWQLEGYLLQQRIADGAIATQA